MVDDPAAEGGALVGVGDGGVEGGLGEAGGAGGDAEAAAVEGAEGDLEALPLVADEPVGLQEGAVPVGGGGGDRLEAHLAFGGAEAEALGGAGREEAGDAVAAGGGAGEEGVEPGPAAVGDPRLGAVDPVPAAVVLPLGLAAEGGRVGAGLGLGEAVAADHAALQHRGQPAFLLLGGAEGVQRVAGEGVDAGGDGDGRPARGELFEDLEVDLVGLASAAVLLRVRQAEETGLAEGREEPFGVRLGGLVLVHLGRELLVGDLPGEGDEVRCLGGGKQAVDIHGDSSGAQSGTGKGTAVPLRVAQKGAAVTPTRTGLEY